MKKKEIAEKIIKNDDCSIVDYCTICPFYDDCNGYNCVELAKKYLEGLNMTEQELYQKWQKEWVDFHNVEVGDVVKVVTNVPKYHLGCGYSTINKILKNDTILNKNLAIGDINNSGIFAKGWWFPFFCLEFVRKAEKKVDKMVTVKGKNYSEDTLQEMIKAYTE